MKETIVTNSLNPEVLQSKGINLPDGFAVVVSDIDYTLLDFDQGHQKGLDAIRRKKGDKFGNLVAFMFDITLEGHRKLPTDSWKERRAFDQLTESTKKLHSAFVSPYGHRVWSRETWIVMAAKIMKDPISAAEVEKLRDIYWQTVAENSPVYSDAAEFLTSFQESIPLILMTGSDSVLKIDEELNLTYDPKYSKNYKRRRVERLDIKFKNVIIGDPIDKPDDRYFADVFKVTNNYTGNKNKVLIVGDSQKNDLEVPAQNNYPTVLIKRD